MFKSAFGISFFASILFTATAECKGVAGIFGLHDSINKIEDVSFLGPKEEKLFLGYRTSIIFIFAGVGLIDHGYVLGTVDRAGSYYPLDQEIISQLQLADYLPAQLPEYKLDVFDYVIGYSLWIILGIILLIHLCNYVYWSFKNCRNKSQRTSSIHSENNTITIES